MRELDRILAFRRASRQDAVLATVVHVTGSAYRRPGGRMLMAPDGQRIGCISGGCLEGEIVKKAWWFTESGAPVVRVYDTTSDNEAVWEFGLGCNGVVHVMLERMNAPGTSAMLDFLDAQRAARKAAAVATVVRGGETSRISVGDRLLLDDSLRISGNLAGSGLESAILAHAADAMREKKSRLAHIGATDVFIEWIGPALSLVIFGAGHDSIPLVNFAADLGWDVTVADGRPAYARPERFPGAQHVVGLAAADLLRGISIGSDTFVVMMTHNYALDVRLLPRILAQCPRYLGILGPRSRAERLFADLVLNEPASLHAPAGLDAGSDTPEAIALSIVAEIQAVANSRTGGKLRHRSEPIHAAPQEVGMSALREAEPALRPLYCESAAG